MATLCQYNITGLCCVCITAGCLQATSVCGTMYGDGSNLTGVAGTVPTGGVIYMPGVTSAPSGYIAADGGLNLKSSYTNLGTCFSGKTFGANIPISGTNYNMAYLDFLLGECNSYHCECLTNMCAGTIEPCFQMLACYITGGYTQMGCFISTKNCDGSKYGITPCDATPFWIGHTWLRTCTGFTMAAMGGWSNTGCERGIAYKPDPSVVSNAGDFANCVTRCCYVASLAGKCFGTDGRWCQNCQSGSATALAGTICKFWVHKNYHTSNCTYITLFDTDFPRCCPINTAWENPALKQTYIIGGTSTNQPQIGTVVNFLCNVVACSSSCPFLGVISGSRGDNPTGTTEAVWFGGASCACSTGATFSLTQSFCFSCIVYRNRLGCDNLHTSPLCSGHPGLRYHCGRCELCKFNACTIGSPSDAVFSETKGPLGNCVNYGVGYDRFISFGTSCFAVLVIAANCTCSVTCYPMTCIGSTYVNQLCYSNPTNTWVAITCDGNLYTSPGNSGSVWTLRVACTCLRSGYTIWNLDNKVAVPTPYGGVFVSCDGTTWNCIWNADKMILGDNSKNLTKFGNYYIGAGTVWSCDLCCSGYSVAPGYTVCSSVLGALVSVNSRVTQFGYNSQPTAKSLGWTQGFGSGLASGILKEAAIYCSSLTTSDGIYWKWKQLATSCWCSTACGGYGVHIGDIIVNPYLNKLYYSYGTNCQVTTSCCICYYIGRYDLCTCTHVDKILVCTATAGLTWGTDCPVGFSHLAYGPSSTCEKVMMMIAGQRCQSPQYLNFMSIAGGCISASCTYVDQCSVSYDAASSNIPAREFIFNTAPNQLAVSSANDPFNCQTTCCAIILAFTADGKANLRSCSWNCVSCCPEVSWKCLPVSYCSNFEPCLCVQVGCIYCAYSAKYPALYGTKYGCSENYSGFTSGPAIAEVSTTDYFYYYGASPCTCCTFVGISRLVGTMPVQAMRRSLLSPCCFAQYSSVFNRYTNGGAPSYITYINGAAYNYDGGVSACFDTGTYFKTPNSGQGYFVKT